MDNTQTWAMIGLFATIMLGGMTLTTTLIMRSTTSAINGLRGEMNARFESVNARFDAMDARFAHLDRDVDTLMRRVWDDRSPG